MPANSPLYLTRAQSRAVDEIAIRDFGMLGLVLMENAGRNCAEAILQLANTEGKIHSETQIVICCGKGNNGGDGFVIARHLAIAGHDPTVLLWADPNELTGDAAANYHILAKANAKMISVCEPEALANHKELFAPPSIIIDALLGTGATGPMRSPYIQAINWINSQNALVFAIDLPSGLDSQTGVPYRPTVNAKHTLTFVAPKMAFLNPSSVAFMGQCHVIDIGIPRAIIQAALKH